MKKILTVVLSSLIFNASAQWSSTLNNFDDSLDMPVCAAPGTQTNPIVLTSYPDGGYFVIWEDNRNMATTNKDIYAQKYDNAGNRLWTADGIPVSNAPGAQYYNFPSAYDQDYRSRSFVATDSAGGFYITFTSEDSSVSNVYYDHVAVQHIRSNGTAVFANAGYAIGGRGEQSQFPRFNPQLIADGNKGFFIAYYVPEINSSLQVFCYKDENGSMKFYGGGRADESRIQVSSIRECGIKLDVADRAGTEVDDYNIWYDGQGGCNIIMNMHRYDYSGSAYSIIACNRLWRAKKDCSTKTYFRNVSGTVCPRITEYKKGDVYLMYYVVMDFQQVICGGSGGPLYTYVNTRLLNDGYLLVDDFSGHPASSFFQYAKGVTLPSTGNINVDMLAAARVDQSGIYSIQGYVYKSEKFDSIPYQHASYNNPDFGYNVTPPASLAKLNTFRDTILASGSYPAADFSLAAGGTHIYAAGLMGQGQQQLVRLQNLELTKIASDSFALAYKTNVGNIPERSGVAIGAEIYTTYTADDISYDLPLIKIADNGTAVFYINDYNRYSRISPIGSYAALSWGAMGRSVNNGVYNNLPVQPVVALDSNGKTGIIAWRDNRTTPGVVGENISMRHLDNLDAFNYQPPPRKTKQFTSFPNYTIAFPAVLFGTSNSYSSFEEYSNSDGFAGTSTVAEIFDNNNLGRTRMDVFENVGDIRRYNGEPYLDRNFTIKTDSTPGSSTPVYMRLYFSKEEFNALKAADNVVTDPGFLSVIRQPNTNYTPVPPFNYTSVAGEELITPVSWDSVDGGYRITIIDTAATGNFFIQKLATTSLCAGSNTSFTSNITGATYKWQLNTGSNFADITDNANYSGSHTATLQLSNIPSSFNGNRYRCVVGVNNWSNTFCLQVVNSWTGAVNDLWENPGNWSCGTVPDANTDVIINSGTVTINSNATCRSLKLNPGADLSVTPGFKLTVTH